MYQALYRKYRPKDFDSVVGQDSIIKTLKNSIIHNNFSHAYMFFGPRGTGKTTISKVFARNINCLSSVDGMACGICDACKVSFSKECVDIIEIDAASNNGVDEIRELKNNINLVPSNLKYKVYIIDEFHMLSAGAFNALLKTLEEPPEHAIFILATTDPQKVPETVISRCQCFSFKRISDIDIKKRLEFVCGEEAIKIDEEVLDKIALFSDGGLRDALGSLDKLVAFSNDKITIDDFNEVNGFISDLDVYNFINSIMIGDIPAVLNSINLFNNSGKNLIQILVQIINYSRNMIVDYYLNDKDINFDIDLLQCFANSLNENMFDIKNCGNVKIYIEMFLLKFINDNVNVQKKNVLIESNSIVSSVNESNASLIGQIKENNDVSFVDESKSDVVDKKISDEKVDDNFDFDNYLSSSDSTDDVSDNYNISSNCVSNGTRKILNIEDINNARINNTFSSASKDLLKTELGNFELLKNYSFDQEIGYLVNTLLDSNVRVVGLRDFIISYDSDAIVEENLGNIIKLNDVYNKITGSNKNIAIVSDAKWDVLKDEYISNLKNNVKYDYVSEPEVLFEEIEKDDIISNSAVSLFGEDIVEFE